ncbi:MAG: hypothetical protein KIG57_05615 [Muribaculaceae bacterium]|nr:hypothetical protein [Muribaculaceae bacterium]
MDEGFGGDLPQPTLYEAQRFRFGGLQAALQASPSLAWSCPTIRYVRWQACGRFYPYLWAGICVWVCFK